MATKTISTKFAIEGESNYKNAVKGIKDEMKIFNSEMARVTAEFANNQNSMAALSAKADVLSRKYENQAECVCELFEALQNAKVAQANWADSVQNSKDKVEELEQRLDSLADSEGDTSEEQAKLTEELKQAQEALKYNQAGYDAATKGVNDWQIRLNYAQSDLHKLDQEVDDNSKLLQEARTSADHCAASIDQYGKQVKAVSEESNVLGDVGAAALSRIAETFTGTGLWNIAVKIFGIIKDLVIESKNAEITIVRGTGAQGEALRNLSDAYEDVMARAKSASEIVAGAIASLNTRLGLTGAELADKSLLFEKFGRATGTDAVQGVGSVIDMLNAYGKTADDLPRTLDLLTAASQSSNASVTTLSKSVADCAFYAQAYGLDLEETIAIMAAAEKAEEGLSSTVSRGMKKAYDDVSESGKTFKQILKELRDGTLSEADAIDLFGNKAVNMSAFLRTGAMDVDAMANSLGDCTGIMEQTAAATESFGDKWRGFWHELIYGDALIGSQYEGFYEIQESADEAADTVERRVVPTFFEAERALFDLLAAADGSSDSIARLSEFLESNDAQTLQSMDGYGRLRDALAEAKAQMSLLESETDKATETVASTLDSMMGRFNSVPLVVSESVNEVIQSLFTQDAYMNQYAANMEEAAKRGVNDGLLKSLADGSQESAEILMGIVEATDEDIAKLNSKWEETQEGREAFSRTLGEMQTDFEERSAALQKEYESAVESFDQYAKAQAAGAKTARGAIDGVSMGGNLDVRMRKLGENAAIAYTEGFNAVPMPKPSGYASGTDYATAGLHWVGEAGPELVMMRGGETVINHAESARLAREAMSAAARAQARDETTNMAAPVVRETVIVNLDTKGIEERIDGVIDAVEAQEPVAFGAITAGTDGELGREKDLRWWSGG